MSKCNKCGCELTNLNSYPSTLSDRYYICKECYKKIHRIWYHKRYHSNPTFRAKMRAHSRQWYRDHKEYVHSYTKIYQRNHILVVNGKAIRINKRPYSSTCEMCGGLPKGKQSLSYHHWNDETPEKGIWVCRICHFIAETVDSIFSQKEKTTFAARVAKAYILKKSTIENSQLLFYR